MSIAALILASAVANGPVDRPPAESARDPVRCRPAPYYVTHRSALPPKLALQDAERRVRSCYLVTLKRKPTAQVLV